MMRFIKRTGKNEEKHKFIKKRFMKITNKEEIENHRMLHNTMNNAVDIKIPKIELKKIEIS